MAELNRKEDQLTTADLAGRTEAQERNQYDNVETIPPEGPKPVRSETEPRLRITTPTTKASQPGPKAVDPRMRDDSTAETTVSKNDATPTQLFSESDIGDLRKRWSNVQTSFVDEPRHAVEEADKLVAAVMQRLAEGFANERSTLEKQWDGGGNVSTEDLRVAMQRYRSFFDRLLNA